MRSENSLPEVVFTPRSQLSDPGQLFKSMMSDLANSRELAWRLFIRNISAKYRQTMLGYLWAFLPPIATTLIFVFLKSQSIFNFGETNVPYPVYVMIGTLLWQGFVDAVNSPIQAVTQSKSMLVKINFPREALILAGFGEVLFNFLIRLILFIFVFIWFKISVPASIIYAPIGILSIFMLGMVIGVLLTPLGILYGDIEKGLVMVLSLWFFLTPVVYPVPGQWPASILAEYNPVSPLLIMTRDWVLGTPTGEFSGFMIISGVSVFLLIIGWLLYRLAMPHLIARIGS